MRQYHDLMELVLKNGRGKARPHRHRHALRLRPSDRAYDLADGFPLLTTKKMFVEVDHLRAALVPARRHQCALAAGARRHDLGRVGGCEWRARAGLWPSVALVAGTGWRHDRPDRQSRARHQGQSGFAPPDRDRVESRRTCRRWRCRPATACSSSMSRTEDCRASSISARRTSFSACRSTSPAMRC